MKQKFFKYIVWLVLLLFGVSLYSLNADFLVSSLTSPEITLAEGFAPEDSITPRYPVTKTIPEEYNDLKNQAPLDLKNPDNIKTTIEYDLKSGTYIVRTRLGDMELGTPMTLTPEEYQNYSMQESLRSYFRQRNEEEFRKEAEKEFNLTDMQFDLGIGERIFGAGGVKVKTQGSADITLGMKRNSTKNPSLPERARTRTFFNFDETVQLNVNASVGTKVNFGMNYNTETSFDFDSKRLKLAYTGEEDEIIKSLEAGNVSMTTNNSLINGGAALFGMKADLQFGKLRINALLAQQESQSKTVNSRGGVQTQSFEIKADSYDENRHFFLSHYFRDTYDNYSNQAPNVRSGILISRIEVWVTNKRSNYEQARNIVAFSDLAESKHISNPQFISNGGSVNPRNKANSLYETIVNNYSEARDKSKVNQTFSGFIEEGVDYENIESARLLEETEYTFNKYLGYISLKSQLQADEVLAVAYEYTYNGQAYQVGEFSTDDTEQTTSNLYVKLLKGTNMSPVMPFWDLMMKNIYSLGAYSVQSEKFKLDILYQSDTTGTYLNYLSEGAIKDSILLRVMNLDRLNSQRQAYPDGIYDFLEGYTILSENGKVIFPVVEPFGSHLRKKINNDVLADKYVFQELYDTTQTAAQQIAEKNKFILRGEYKASSAAEIDLGASNVPRGSVRVTAGGVVLTENVDYTVDYTSGRVTLLNEAIISSGTDVSVTLEDRSMFSMQRKTMMGLDLNYELSKNLTLGGTIMHLSEMPLTTKTAFGDESIKNTLWGLNMSYRSESQWLTNLVDKLPLLTLTKPSQISFNAEFANLIAGHYENKNTGGYSYLDDFESTQTGFDLLNPYPWTLASTPNGATDGDSETELFPESSFTNDIAYGKNRALLAWYYIDGIFTRENSTLMPGHIKNDKDMRSNHYMRGVKTTELYPNRDQSVYSDNNLSILNLAYYPNERGPYNLDADLVNPDGTLQNPEKRWGGIMRKIDQSDFETANIEYIEFWMMDPFIYDNTVDGGDLYFNLGDISEDILKDEMKFFENGLPIDGDTSKVELTPWGKVPRIQSTVYAFDNTAGARALQDVGLNGLSSDEEKEYPTYVEYLNKLQTKLSGDTWNNMLNDPFSQRNDPAGDTFSYFRSSYYDSQEADILTRYKRYNGTEGNSAESSGSYNAAAKTLPDVEDLNQDNTLSKNERYFQYKVELRPSKMKVGSNYIVNVQQVKVDLPNGDKEHETINWYQFKIPIKQPQKKVGSIQDFKSIRFMRMFMTDFKETTILRFGKFELVRGEWRTYEQDLSAPGTLPTNKGTLDVSTVNIEENGSKQPVSYVLPPGISRTYDPGQPQIQLQNEQAISLKVTDLASQDARAIYKNTSYDLRQYKRLQLFTHAEALEDNSTNLRDGEFSVFLRLGSDYKNNYYEYEVMTKLTPPGSYSSNNEGDQETVWPDVNKLNFNLEVLTDLKQQRNKAKREGDTGVSFQQIYSGYDPDNPNNIISVVGNPSLAEVKTIMIGVRNNSKDRKSGEIWVNELRLTDYNEEGGWAANANLNVNLSDLGSVNLSGRIETAGFGALDQSVNERRLDDYSQFNVATNIELGKFFPEKAKVSIPLYYSYSKEITSPKYNPLDKDIELKDALNNLTTEAEKDSVKSLSQDVTVSKGIAFNNVRVNIRSKTPMPYDPANFSFGYSFRESNIRNPETVYETTKDYNGNFAYTYVPYVKQFKPFEKMASNAGYTRFLKQLGINYLPSNISFQTAMTRNYYEIQLRDLTNLENSNIPASFSQNFNWDRAFNLSWALTNNLNFSFTSGTNARIEEPYMQVNKKLNPDQYQVWKDSVIQSILDLGTPMKYDQSFVATYNMPFQFIPVLDWVTGSATYNSTYNWERVTTVDETEVGNTIRNQRQVDIQGGLNLLNLYNKNKFLKDINQKFGATRSTTQRGKQQTTKRKPTVLEREVTLNTDSGTIVQHGLLTKKLYVRAKGADGKVYNIKYKTLDFARIQILNKDTVTLKLSIKPGLPPTEDFAYKSLQHLTRFAMMVRRINIQYSLTDGMMLPGFLPEIGSVFGQKNYTAGMAPGLGFAFGDVRRSYIDDAADKGWLVMDESILTPAMISKATTLNVRANLEPINGLKIDLNANRVETKTSDIKFMLSGMPETLGGNFTMTTITFGTAFQSIGNQENGYNSKAFEQLRSNREIIGTRIDNNYAALNGSSTKISRNSSDVLIPAFLSAYTGQSANKVGLTPFPSLSNLRPNWRITYDGLVKLPFIKDRFKSVVLSHQYRSSYNVGSYTSFLQWENAGNGMGYVNGLPSSPYSISSVSISESFTPLFGVDATFLNNITSKLEYRKIRNLSLNLSSYQIVEALTNEFIVGVGYKLTEFNKVLNMKKTENFSNDLTIRLDFSHRRIQSLIRKIEDGLTQPTTGNIAKTLQFSADYGFSRSLTLRAFYDLQINEPLVSSTTYPTSNSNYGVTVRFSLSQ
ncbi:cell surface protein SprA [Massilibacteroides sp.]|uniref:T9SS outer membrane translocon Sov/SprA n=1 Tax=Massilibacteroides sp. TaxID=2034766 RepID=UPI00260980A5|nr:cell surface protein SprA [Massilibacteroides sp.]MDD4514806.1 cell surface protein SprA [Massilibacteroides sp.]